MQRRHDVLVDASVPLLVAAVIVVGELLHGGRSSAVAPIVLGLGAAATLLARRTAPWTSLASSGALVAILFHVDRPAAAVAVVAPAVALYSLTLRRGRLTQAIAGLAGVGAVLAADLLHSGSPGLLQTFGHVLLVAIPLLVAEQVRTHRSYISVLTERLALTERSRQQDAERRAEHERVAIARELHDVVAHTLTEINIQAAAAAEAAETGDARSALERIEQTSHRAIGELRAIVGVLRDPRRPEQAPRAPTPGLMDLAELVERARAAGLEVRLRSEGPLPSGLSEASSVAAYRIVQESLTNARRHAPGAPVSVDLRFDRAQLSLIVENGPGDSSSEGGHVPGLGILGMRERAAALGGSFDAGPTDNGFLVSVHLPYRPSG